jgi:ribonuclease P protein component
VNHVFRFKREERLKKRDEIRAVFNRGKVVTCSGAKLFVLQNGFPFNRIVFTFARKFGNAVERNRARRVGREVYRQVRNRLQCGFDLVLLVYPGKDSFSVRMKQVGILFSKAGLLVDNTQW